jgi:aromatic ring-opening dioxygenase LigB subunit
MTSEKGIVAGCITPHPPLLIPEVGGRELERVESTKRAMEDLSDRVKALAPEVLVMISPHSPVAGPSFGIKVADKLEGSFTAFGSPQVRLKKDNDRELARKIMDMGEARGIEITPLKNIKGRWLSEGEELDHGLLVPLYYFDQKFETPVVSVSISYLSYRDHFHFGELIDEACAELGRRAVFVASGDLSHRLIPGAPAGFNPRGKEFDRIIGDIVTAGEFERLYDIDEDLVEDAGECGLRSIHALWGAIHRYRLKNQMLSYEGPFGVGYLVSFHRCLRNEDQ